MCRYAQSGIPAARTNTAPAVARPRPTASTPIPFFIAPYHSIVGLARSFLHRLLPAVGRRGAALRGGVAAAADAVGGAHDGGGRRRARGVHGRPGGGRVGEGASRAAGGAATGASRVRGALGDDRALRASDGVPARGD